MHLALNASKISTIYLCLPTGQEPRTIVGSYIRDSADVLSGVTQVSMNGPLIFNICTCDLIYYL